MLFSRFCTLLCALVTVGTAYNIYFFLIHHCTNSLSSLHIFVHHCTFCASLHTKTSSAQVSLLARVDRPQALGFRQRAVVMAQTGPCLHQKMGSMRSHGLQTKYLLPFKRAKSAANSAKTSGTLT